MGDGVMSSVVGGEGWRRRKKGMGEQGEMGEGKKKETSEASFLAERWHSVCVRVCCFFFFCNFIRFGRSRRSARVNNSLQSADVITF